jgi:hypothetical protein
MSLNESITSLRTMLDSAENEIKSLEGGRKASSARARLSLQQIKKASHTLRKDIITHSKALPVKKRVPKSEAEPPETDDFAAPVKKSRAKAAKSEVVEK